MRVKAKSSNSPPTVKFLLLDTATAFCRQQPTIVKVNVEKSDAVFELFAPIFILVVDDRMTAQILQCLAFAWGTGDTDDLALGMRDRDLRDNL